MSIEDVMAFDDYELMDVGEYKPIRSELVTVSRDAWDDMQSYIGCLEADNKRLRKELEEALELIVTIQEASYGINDSQ